MKITIKKILKLDPNKKYPIKDNEYDLATSWATLEHVGNINDQKQFLNEVSRVSKKFFLTTPYKYFPYELHTGLFFLHWLPGKFFRKILKIMSKDFWANEKYLHLLSVSDVKKIIPKNKDIKVKLFYSFGFLPTHIIIYKK